MNNNDSADASKAAKGEVCPLTELAHIIDSEVFRQGVSRDEVIGKLILHIKENLSHI